MTRELNLSGKWLAQSIGGESHVTPLEDALEHIQDRSCWCGPFIDGKMVIHHSFDGRELAEGDMRPEYQERIQ